MGQNRTKAAERRSGRGVHWVGKFAFAVGAFAVASGFAFWIADSGADSELAARTEDAQSARAGFGSSFADRFGSRLALDPQSIRYPSRPSVRQARGDFNTEFAHIQGTLAELSREAEADEPEPVPAPAPAVTQAAPAAPAIPLPRSRPAEANIQLASAPVRNEPPQPQADNRTLFQKIADLVPERLRLASLEPSGATFGRGPDLAALGYDSATAVYDISAKVVYMPDRTRLEAHSGLGSLMDNPAHVDKPNVGPTPPGVYDMKPRERLFHGVPALRMTPVDGTDTLGRVGLLAHPYMLGPNGDSNGCVSIKDYDRFLKAYHNGEVRRIVVVPTLKDAASASARSQSQS